MKTSFTGDTAGAEMLRDFRLRIDETVQALLRNAMFNRAARERHVAAAARLRETLEAGIDNPLAAAKVRLEIAERENAIADCDRTAIEVERSIKYERGRDAGREVDAALKAAADSQRWQGEVTNQRLVMKAQGELESARQMLTAAEQASRDAASQAEQAPRKSAERDECERRASQAADLVKRHTAQVIALEKRVLDLRTGVATETQPAVHPDGPVRVFVNE